MQAPEQRQAARAPADLYLPMRFTWGSTPAFSSTPLRNDPARARPCESLRKQGAQRGSAHLAHVHKKEAHLRRPAPSSSGCPSGAHTPPVRAAMHGLEG